ncbi:unnamed protein product [Effrenium voratum]|nr:unnamed protein product [Effrenium voratum]
MEGKRIWEAHPSPYGVPYYYNPQTKESRWSLPTGPLDLVVPVEAQTKATQAAPTKKNAKKKEPGKDASEKPLSVSSSASSDSEAEEGNPAKLSVAERTKLKVTAFTEMLEEKEVQAFDSFERWLPSLVTDQRFLAIPKKARKGLFLSVAQGLSKGRRRSEAEQRQSGRAGLQELLGQAKQADWFREAQSTAAAVASLELRFKSDERWQNAFEKWRWVEAARQEVAEEKAPEHI